LSAPRRSVIYYTPAAARLSSILSKTRFLFRLPVLHDILTAGQRYIIKLSADRGGFDGPARQVLLLQRASGVL
jgi:hypothetical protein